MGTSEQRHADVRPRLLSSATHSVTAAYGEISIVHALF